MLQKKNILFVTVLLIVIYLTYKIIFQNYFEQDEWAVMADMIVFGNLPFGEKLSRMLTTSSIFSHFIPLTTLLSFVINKLFGLNFEYYAALSIAMHYLNSLLVYVLALKLTRKTLIAIASSFLFAVHNLSSQVITWIASSLGAGLSTLFLLLSVVLFIIYIDKRRKTFLVFSVATFIASLFLKETSLTLIFLFPILLIINISGKKNKNQIKEIAKTLFFPAAVLAYFALKLFFSKLFPHPVPTVIAEAPSLIYTLIKIIFYPVISLSQIFDPGGQLFILSPKLISEIYPFLDNIPQTPKVVEFVVPDVLYLLLSIIFILIVCVTFIFAKKDNIHLSKIILISLSTFLLSILPYVPLPRFSTYLEQRYYYTPNIFASLLAAAVIYYWTNKIFPKFLARIVFVFLIGSVVFQNYTLIQQNIAKRVSVAKERKQILSDIKRNVPVLKREKNVFYVTGNGEDYLIENLKVPFQSGFGNILMMWYFDEKYINPKLADLGFLYQLDDQGYKEINGNGFGYYYELEKLKLDLEKGKFTISDISALYYDRKLKKIRLYNNELNKLIDEKIL